MIASAEAKNRYSLVTVAHTDDYGLLCLQARSLRRYLDRALFEQIIIVENPRLVPATRLRDLLQREYGDLAASVRFVDARDIANIPTYVSGWFSQQILKLMVARFISTDRYVVLDAKNHLIFPLNRRFFEAPSTKMRLYYMNYEQHVMRPYFESTLRYLRLTPQDRIRAFVPTTTPFPLPTEIVRDLIRFVEAKEQMPFPEAFVHNGFRRTEFFLFGAYLLASDYRLTDVYDFSGLKVSTIWPCSTGRECEEMIVESERKALPVFAVHRRAIPKLDARTQYAVASFWHRRGLFKTIDQPLCFLSMFNRRLGPASVMIPQRRRMAS